MGQSPVAPPPPPAPEASADRLIDALPDPSAAAAVPAADGPTDDLLSQLAGAEIDRMLAAADVEPVLPPPPVPPTVEPAAPVVAAVPPPPVAEVPPPAPAAVDLNAVLAAAIAGPPPTAATVADDAVPLDGLPDRRRLPLWLRPLAVLSAPLDRCSDRVREAVGKVAVVTLINAVAVLAYVALFRHR